MVPDIVEEETWMKIKSGALALLASLMFAVTAQAATIKVGVIGAFSGPFSLYGTGWQQAFKIFMDQHGGKIEGNDIEFVIRDLPASDPQKARALAQELVIRDKVQYLAGFVFTADAMAVAPIAEEAQIPTIVLNAASSPILDQSQFMLRTSFTTYQVAVPIANYAIDTGSKTAVTMVSDYVPGVEEEKGFAETFKKRGGQVLESIRMPLSTTDFGPFLQRAKAANPDTIFVFLPGGPSTYAYLKTYLDIGMRNTKIRFLGSGETQEFDLQSMGEAALGLETGFMYSGVHDSPLHKKYLADLQRLFPGAIASLPHTEGYDAMSLIAAMIKATGGKADGEKAIAAVKGMSWEGLRGPLKVDPKTRDLIQNIYMRRVERDPASGLLINKEFKTYEMQPDYGREFR